MWFQPSALKNINVKKFRKAHVSGRTLLTAPATDSEKSLPVPSQDKSEGQKGARLLLLYLVTLDGVSPGGAKKKLSRYGWFCEINYPTRTKHSNICRQGSVVPMKLTWPPDLPRQWWVLQNRITDPLTSLWAPTSDNKSSQTTPCSVGKHIARLHDSWSG